MPWMMAGASASWTTGILLHDDGPAQEEPDEVVEGLVGLLELLEPVVGVEVDADGDGGRRPVAERSAVGGQSGLDKGCITYYHSRIHSYITSGRGVKRLFATWGTRPGGRWSASTASGAPAAPSATGGSRRSAGSGSWRWRWRRWTR